VRQWRERLPELLAEDVTLQGEGRAVARAVEASRGFVVPEQATLVRAHSGDRGEIAYLSVDKTRIAEPTMDAALTENDIRVHVAQSKEAAEARLAFHQRLVLSALIAGVSLWIRVVDTLPESRDR
jgi:hypothetical protein